MNVYKSRTSPKRILNILEEILSDPENYTAKKIAHKLKIPLATVYRHLETLCDEKFLITTKSKTFIPGPKIRAILFNSLPYEPNFDVIPSYYALNPIPKILPTPSYSCLKCRKW